MERAHGGDADRGSDVMTDWRMHCRVVVTTVLRSAGTEERDCLIPSAGDSPLARQLHGLSRQAQGGQRTSTKAVTAGP
eukprot:5585972-Heterocapsa_arctica.AAC.1